MTGESTQHFIAKDSVITKCRCNLTGKCKFIPCPVCHARGPCVHCVDGPRKHKCKYWEERVATKADIQKRFLIKECAL